MTRDRHSSACVWLLLAAALFMRAVLPQGYMPARTDHGTITVRVCGSSGHVLQIPTGTREAPRGSARAEPPCAFAGLGAPALPPPAVADLIVSKPLELAFAGTAEAALRLTAPLAHPPARGPPPTA
jgi:hypothetical protein